MDPIEAKESPPSPRTRASMLGSAFNVVKNYFTPERTTKTSSEGFGITPLARDFASLTLDDSTQDTTDSFKTSHSRTDESFQSSCSFDDNPCLDTSDVAETESSPEKEDNLTVIIEETFVNESSNDASQIDFKMQGEKRSQEGNGYDSPKKFKADHNSYLDVSLVPINSSQNEDQPTKNISILDFSLIPDMKAEAIGDTVSPINPPVTDLDLEELIEVFTTSKIETTLESQSPPPQEEFKLSQENNEKKCQIVDVKDDNHDLAMAQVSVNNIVEELPAPVEVPVVENLALSASAIIPTCRDSEVVEETVKIIKEVEEEKLQFSATSHESFQTTAVDAEVNVEIIITTEDVVEKIDDNVVECQMPPISISSAENVEKVQELESDTKGAKLNPEIVIITELADDRVEECQKPVPSVSVEEPVEIIEIAPELDEKNTATETNPEIVIIPEEAVELVDNRVEATSATVEIVPKVNEKQSATDDTEIVIIIEETVELKENVDDCQSLPAPVVVEEPVEMVPLVKELDQNQPTTEATQNTPEIIIKIEEITEPAEVDDDECQKPANPILAEKKIELVEIIDEKKIVVPEAVSIAEETNDIPIVPPASLEQYQEPPPTEEAPKMEIHGPILDFDEPISSKSDEAKQATPEPTPKNAEPEIIMPIAEIVNMIPESKPAIEALAPAVENSKPEHLNTEPEIVIPTAEIVNLIPETESTLANEVLSPAVENSKLEHLNVEPEIVIPTAEIVNLIPETESTLANEVLSPAVENSKLEHLNVEPEIVIPTAEIVNLIPETESTLANEVLTPVVKNSEPENHNAEPEIVIPAAKIVHLIPETKSTLANEVLTPAVENSKLEDLNAEPEKLTSPEIEAPAIQETENIDQPAPITTESNMLQNSPESQEEKADEICNLDETNDWSTEEQLNTEENGQLPVAQEVMTINFLTPIQEVFEDSFASGSSVSPNELIIASMQPKEIPLSTNYSMDSPSNELIMRKGPMMVESTPQPAGLANRVAKSNISDVSPIVICLAGEQSNEHSQNDSPFSKSFLDNAMLQGTPDQIEEKGDETASKTEAESSSAVLDTTKNLSHPALDVTKVLPSSGLNETKILDNFLDHTHVINSNTHALNSTVTIKEKLDHTVTLAKAIENASLNVTRIMADDFNTSLISPMNRTNVIPEANANLLLPDLYEETRENWNATFVNNNKNSGTGVLKEICDNVLDNNMGSWPSTKSKSPEKMAKNEIFSSLSNFDFNTNMQRPAVNPFNRESLFIKFDPCYQPRSILDQINVSEVLGNTGALDLAGLEISTQSNEEKLEKEIERLRVLYNEREQEAQSKLDEMQLKRDALENQYQETQMVFDKIEERNNGLKKKLQDVGNSNVRLAYISQEYQKMARNLRTELEERRKVERPNAAAVAAERDSYQQHLKSAEAAFIDVLSKFEKLKNSLIDLKKSVAQQEKEAEELRRESIRVEELIKVSEMTVATSLEELRRALREENEQYGADVTRVNAQLRKTELSLKNSQDVLDKTVAENEKIATLCDDIIAGRS